MMDKQKLPRNATAEQHVLGSFLLETLPQLASRLRTDLFSTEANQKIARAIIDLHREEKPYDNVMVSNYLRDTGEIERVGGVLYLNELMDRVVTTASIGHYLDILEDKSLRREMMDLSWTLYERSTDEGTSVLDLENTIDIMTERLVSRANRSSETIGEIIGDTKGAILAEFEAGEIGIPSGLVKLDKKLSGFRDGKAYILAGRPGHGKSSLALHMTIGQAKAGYTVGFISIEMTAKSLVCWLLDHELGRDHRYIPVGGKKREWRDKIDSILTDIKETLNTKLIIDDTPYMDVHDVIKSAYEMRYSQQIDILYIDYMQLLEGGGRNSNREQEVSVVSRRISALKKQLGIPIVTLAQINRSLKDRKGNRPVLSDLRESGAIEQDANVVIFSFDPRKFGEDDAQHELHIAKNRDGPVTQVSHPIEVYWDRAAKTFCDGVPKESA